MSAHIVAGYNGVMPFAPQQDWSAFSVKSSDADAEWIRGLGTSERFAIYADMFGVVWTARQNGGKGDWDELDRWSWQQKLALHLRYAEAYKRLDEFRNARAATTNLG